MAEFSRADVLKLARLARLKLTDEEAKLFQAEMSKILDYFEQLKEIDLENYQPTSQVTGLTNVMRADKVKDYGASPQELLKNAPATEDGQIKVGRVL